MRLYAEIQRVDDEQRMVSGYASTEARAADGMVISRAAMQGALEDYMAFANVREMHQLIAVGVARSASVDDAGLYIDAHVVDDAAWAKVKAGVYRGFSLGAKITERDPDDRTVIRGISINEISLVDRPSDPGAVFDIWRADGADSDEAEPIDAGLTEVADPATDYQAALQRAERIMAEPVTTPPLPLISGLELRRGLYGVAQLGYLLSELAYVLSDATLESQIEGDNSPVPAKLREAVKSLGAAYKAMSDEELTEMLNGVGVDVALENGMILLAAAGGEIQRTSAVLADDVITRLNTAIAGVIPPQSPIVTENTDEIAELRRSVEAISTDRDALVRTFTDTVTRLSDRLETIAAQPAPARAVVLPAGVTAIDKGGDGAGSEGEAVHRSVPTDEEVRRALAAMPADDRALLLTRAALTQPIAIRTR